MSSMSVFTPNYLPARSPASRSLAEGRRFGEGRRTTNSLLSLRKFYEKNGAIYLSWANIILCCKF